MTQNLSEMRCTPARRHDTQLTETEIAEMLDQLPGWALIEEEGEKKLRRSFKFTNFVSALEFANQVGAIAEDEGHHPVITLTWGRATVAWYTHMIHGLHKNDFIMAAKTDRLRAPG
ncbi:MAG: 4a-hydroxytetrahydrobiopterin dehydratase [Anaerolineae bacterium]|jgi:4a-hydroxytetrahydrobiopterin dehydratase